MLHDATCWLCGEWGIHTRVLNVKTYASLRSLINAGKKDLILTGSSTKDPIE